MTGQTRVNAPKKFFYGYWVLLATVVFLFIQAGCGFYAFSLFVKPLQDAFGWSRGAVMVAWTIYYLAQGVASPFIGRLVDRLGARQVIATGAFLAGLGFVMLSLVQSIWFFYLSYIVVGAGLAACGQVPTSAIVSNWFKKRRGWAIGIMGIGIGAGGIILSPLIGGYLIPTLGRSAAYLTLAGLTWAGIIPLALFVVKTKPAEMGLYPDGLAEPETVTTTSAAASGGLTLKAALVTSAFWLAVVSFVASSCSQVGLTQNQVPYLQDLGLSAGTAATMLGIVGLGSAFGKFGFGWLCDFIKPKYAYFIGVSLQVVSLIILMRVDSATSPAVIWFYAVLFGLGMGSWLPTMAMLTSSTFGLLAYGAIWGTVTAMQSLGNAVGPLFAGLVFDRTQSYHWAFIVFLVLYALSLVTILGVRTPKRK